MGESKIDEDLRRMSEAVNAELEQEYALLASPKTDIGPHLFTGRTDRDCEACGLPDRHQIHVSREKEIEIEFFKIRDECLGLEYLLSGLVHDPDDPRIDAIRNMGRFAMQRMEQLRDEYANLHAQKSRSDSLI